MSTEAPNLKLEPDEPAVARLKKRATRVSNSESIPSGRKRAKPAKNTRPSNPQRNIIAGFILRKYVKAEKIVYGRDMAIAYKLADRHLDLEFWTRMPAKNQLYSLVILWSQESRNRLTRAWQAYTTKLKIQRAIIIDKPSHKYIIGDKAGEDYIAPPKQPRSALEFCR